MRKASTCCLLALTALLNLNRATAQWSTDPAVNTPVCVAQDKQIDLRMLKDGTGGCYVVWKDYRAGISDVYMQRISASGVPMWTLNGLAICTNPADQSTPAIATDMVGGAIITWSDWRSNIERDIYAQRVDSNGNILWATDGVIVTDKTAREHNPKIVSDNAGGAYIIWEQQSGLWDVWAQRIDASGNRLWGNGGIPVCTVNANRINPKIQDDGFGGVTVVWQDERSGDYDVYGQRLDKSGTLLWGAGGKLICSAPDAQTDPKIDPDSIGGSYVVWIDRRSGSNYDVYGQRVDSNGNTLWASTGVAICNASGSQSAQDILSNNGTHGLIVTWKDKRSGNYDIYAQKLDEAGNALWASNGVAVCNAIKDQLNPNIIEDKNGGAVIVWQDSSAGSYDVKAQRVDASGNMLWPSNGVDIGTALWDQVSPKSVTDGSGGAIFAFQDGRSGAYDIYVHHLYSNGTYVAPTAVAELSEGRIASCYPNPFNDHFTISVNTNDAVSVQAFDITGRNVPSLFPHSITQQHGRCTIEMDATATQVAAGVYFVRINTTKGSETIRVVKAAN